MLAIIISYYKLTFFEETLKSLSEQTDKRFKVYIGDDASPENPTMLLEQFKEDFKCNYRRFDKNVGGTSLVTQWDRCIDLTNDEEWIMILGDDDILGPNVIKEFYENYKEIREKKIDVIRFSTKIINENGEEISNKFEHPTLETGTDFLVRKFAKKTRSSLSEYLFKKEKVKEKKFRDLPFAWHSDDLAVLEFSIPNFIYSINNACVFVRVSNLSITGNSSTNDRKREATFQFFEILFSEYSSVFTRYQKKVILEKLEVTFLNIPSFKNYKTIMNYHFKEISLGSAVKFQMRLVKYRIVLILKKINLFSSVYAVYTKLSK